MSGLKSILAEQRSFQNLSCSEIRLVKALRLAAMAEKAALQPMDYLAEKLGGEAIASQFAVLMASYSRIWPENIHLHRPCCKAISYDEYHFIQLLRCASALNDVAFDHILKDILPKNERQILYFRFFDFAQNYARHLMHIGLAA